MGWRVRFFFLAATAGLLIGSPARAGIPDPALSTIPNVLYAPGGSTPYTCTIVGSDGPVEGAVVQIVFSAAAEAVLCWCNGEVPPEFALETDASGEATFFIAAGGCLDPADFVDPPIEVFADGILMAQVGGVSADLVDGAGLKPGQGWDPVGFCTTGLPDAVYVTPPISFGAYDFCTDFDSNLVVDLDDAVFITPAISHGLTCAAQ
jgi:hypothetical protein